MITHESIRASNNGNITLAFSEIKRHLEKLSREERRQLSELIQHYQAFDIIGNLPVKITRFIFQNFTPRELIALRFGNNLKQDE